MQLRQQFFDAVHYSDDVGAGLPLNIQDDRGILVCPRRLLHVLHTFEHGGNVGEANGRAIAIGDDERAVAVTGNELIVGVDGVGLMRAVERPLGLVNVGLR